MLRRLALALVAASLLVRAGAAQDTCATAVQIGLSQPAPFDTTGMTASQIDWSTGCGTTPRRDTWFSFVAPADGVYLASACGARNCSLELFSGACGALERIDCDNGRCRFESSFSRGGKLYFRAEANETIHARIGQWLPGVGDTWGTFVIDGAVTPAHDSCATPMPITDGASVFVDTFVATLEGPPPPCGPQAARDLWFEFVPTVTGTYEVATCDLSGATFPTTAIAVYGGTCGQLSLVGCSDSGCAGGTAAVNTFQGDAGQRYLIRVLGTFYSTVGQMTLDRVGGAPGDECSTAPSVDEGAFNPYTLGGATLSVEPWTCGSAVADVWRRHTVQVAGTYTAYAYAQGAPSSTRVALEVYEGPCGAGQLLGCDEGSSSIDSPIVTFTAAVGDEVLLRVGANGSAGVSGAVRLVLGPPNDACADALPLALEAWTSFETGEASASPFPWSCTPPALPQDIWFSATAASNGPLSVVVLEQFNSLNRIEIYEGGCQSPLFVACAPAGPSGFDRTVTFQATAGKDYLIRVNDPNYSADGLILVSEGAPPANDECVAAAPIVAGDAPFDLLFATRSNDPAPSCGSGGPPTDPKDVWFVYDAPQSGRVSLQTCSESADALTLYAGVGCAGKTPLACTRIDPSATCGAQSGQLLVFDAIAGQRYFVRVHGDDGGPGTITLAEASIGPIGAPYCGAQPNSTGLSTELTATGSTGVVFADVTLEASRMPAGVLGLFVVSATTDFVVGPGGSQGNLCLGGFIGRYDRAGELFVSDGSGEGDLALDFGPLESVPNQFVPILPGDTWHFQLWHRDSVGGTQTANFSNGLTIAFD